MTFTSLLESFGANFEKDVWQRQFCGGRGGGGALSLHHYQTWDWEGRSHKEWEDWSCGLRNLLFVTVAMAMHLCCWRAESGNESFALCVFCSHSNVTADTYDTTSHDDAPSRTDATWRADAAAPQREPAAPSWSDDAWTEQRSTRTTSQPPASPWRSCVHPHVFASWGLLVSGWLELQG